MKYKYTYKQIAKEINRTEAGIKSMKKNNPRILELIVKGLMFEEQISKYTHITSKEK
jgi:hypothetical protein